jgi:DNA-entry nuclease
MKNIKTLGLCLIIGLVLSGCTNDAILSDSDLSVQSNEIIAETTTESTESTEIPVTDSTDDQNTIVASAELPLFKIPEFAGEPFVEINGNVPTFTQEELTTKAYEVYAPLDDLGRPQTAVACLGKETMPADGEERDDIGMIKPVGWHLSKYPDIISDLYLYNRCHLIGWQLGAENANELNLITGTRYLNVTGMLPFENLVDDYIDTTGNHVLYRVAPIYVQDELVCRGVLMEAKSIETDDISFCVYCFNVQPGICIDYATGDNWVDETYTAPTTVSDPAQDTEDTEGKSYVLNTHTMKIHLPNCQAVDKIAEYNRQDYTGDIDDLLSQGYSPCGYCHPE